MVKKKKHFDVTFNYLEEMYFPTLKHKWYLLHTDPVWYRTILVGIVVETIITIYVNPWFPELLAGYHLICIRIQIIFNVMYCIDILLTFLQKFFFKFRYPYPNPIRRPAPVMCMEILSIVPLELFLVPIYNISEDDRELYIRVSTVHSLKIIRFFYHVYNNRRDLNNVFNTRLLELCIILVVFAGYCVHIIRLLGHYRTPQAIYNAFIIISCNVAGRGTIVNDVRHQHFSVYGFEIPNSLATIFLWCIAIFPTTCFMILSHIETNQHRYNYSTLIHLFTNKIAKKFQVSGQKYKMLMDYFKAHWILRGGFSREYFHEFVEYSLRVEIAMDHVWPAYEHSYLFRNCEYYMLRSLAILFKRHIRMEGEYVFSKHQKKSGMIYISSGTIEVMSNENAEAGVICLTAGTCVGEAALILPHNSPVDFRCKTVCELFELDRLDFINFVRFHPAEFQQLKLNIHYIIMKARKIKAHNAKFNQQDFERNQMIWMKSNLHTLMAHRAAHKNVHEMTNIYLHHELEQCVSQQKHIFHTVEFFDKLAIHERSSVDQDLVFVRNTCPWILKSNSPIVRLWDKFIFVTTIFSALVVSYGFCIEYTDKIKLYSAVVHIIFLFDLVVQIITPVSSLSTARTLNAVLSERLHTLGFFLDLVAVYYWKMIAFVIDTQLPWYELLKLVKLWRVWKFFAAWSNQFLLNIILYSIVLGVSAYACLIYVLSCLFTLANITDKQFSSLIIQFATGVGMPFYDATLQQIYSPLFVLANFLSLIVELSVTAIICSSLYLHYIAKTQIVNTITALSKYAKYEDNRWLHIRLHAYFNVLVNDKDPLLSAGNVARLFELPKHFEIVMKSNVHINVIRKLQMFKDFPDNLIMNLLLETELMTCYRHSIFVSRGIIYNEVFILVEGQCRTLINGKYKKTKLYEPLNLLETCYKLPAVTSTVALSDVMILKFNFDKFIQHLHQHDVEYNAFMSTIKINRRKNRRVMMKLLYEPFVIVRSKTDEPSFKRFPYFAIKNSFEEFDYHIPFDRIKPFDFIKYLLMRTTFYPEGTFLKRYEIIRCMLAFLSAFFFTIPALNIGAYVNRTNASAIMLALDMFALFDIYIRMHVAYYKKDGILVTHPLSTARYYISHGFFIDSISVFPFDIFPMKVQYRVGLNAIHALQLHRIRALGKYYNINQYYYISNTISMVCYILFCANFMAGLLFVYDCYSWTTDEQVPKPNCTLFKFEETNAHFHILFMVMSALESSGMSGEIKVSDLDDVLSAFICILCIVGVMATILHKGYIFSCYITKIMEKYQFIVGLKKLIDLLSTRKGNKFLVKEISNYYDLYWLHVGSQNLHKLTENMINALRRDILFRFYGDNMVNYSLFSENITDTIMFIKNIFLQCEPLVIPKNGYVLTINDINQYIYLLNKGSVDVLAPDGTKLIELTAGAMFGNFKIDTYSRQMVSIVANVNLDLLSLRSTDFNKTIEYFPSIYKTYSKAIIQHSFYIPSTKPIKPRLRMTLQEYMQALRSYSIFKIIDYVHLVYVCYIGIFVEMYQLAVGEMHVIYLLVQYSMDFMHLVREYFKFRMPYKDEHGAPIFEIKKIVARQMLLKSDVVIMILTVIYLDLFLTIPILFFGHYKLENVSYWITLLRLNRLLRIYYILAAYHRLQDKLSNCSNILIKWVFVLYWVIVSYQGVAALTALLDSVLAVDKSNILRNVPVEWIKNLRYLPPQDKLELYARYFYFSSLIHIDTNDEYYGPSTLAFNIYTILLYMYSLIIASVLLCRFFEAMVNLAALRSVILTWNSFLRFYMRKRHGTFMIKQRVVENAKHTWSKTYYRSDFIMKQVCARYLKEIVMLSMYGYLFRRHPVFSHTHMDFVRQLGLHCRLVIYPCNYVIAYKNENRSCMYFIHKGEVAAYNVDFGYPEIALQSLKQGDSFGLVQGLGSTIRNFAYTYITLKHCEIIELEWNTWNYLLPHFPATKSYIFQEAPKYEDACYIPYLVKEIIQDPHY